MTVLQITITIRADLGLQVTFQPATTTVRVLMELLAQTGEESMDHHPVRIGA